MLNHHHITNVSPGHPRLTHILSLTTHVYPHPWKLHTLSSRVHYAPHAPMDGIVYIMYRYGTGVIKIMYGIKNDTILAMLWTNEMRCWGKRKHDARGRTNLKDGGGFNDTEDHIVTQLVQTKGLTATARWCKIRERNDSGDGEGRCAGLIGHEIENRVLKQYSTNNAHGSESTVQTPEV